MPAIAGRTRAQVRLSVGMNVNGVRQIAAIAGGGTTSWLTNSLFGGTSDHVGKWLLGTGPVNNLGTLFRVTASTYSAPTTTLTFYPAGTSVVAADTADLFDLKYDPLRIHDYINQAIMEVTGLAYDPEESLALHGDGRQRRFDVPSEFIMLNGIYRRAQVQGALIHDATTAWDEAAAPTNVTRSVDTQDYKLAPGSNKFVIAGAFTTGVVSSKAISSLNLSGYDYVEFWVKSTIATAAGDFTLLLDDTALAVSALETLSIPALVANTWTFVRVALANPALDSAIISVGLNAAVNIAANTVWINDVRAVLDSTATWVKEDSKNWRIDEEARQVVMFFAPPYQLLKLTGGDKPLLLTTDAAVNEVDDEFVIARATELTLLSAGPDAQSQEAIMAWKAKLDYWHNAAVVAKRSLPLQFGNRTVS